MRRFEGRRVLVTGASSGIGRACATRLASEGARLVLVGRNQRELEALASETGAEVVAADLADPASFEAVAARLAGGSPGSPIHGWVLAAGVHAFKPLSMESPESLDRLWAINVRGTLGLLAVALKRRLFAKPASVVLFSSVAVARGGAGIASYAATKGALEGAVRSLALEGAPRGLRVNAVAAGVVRTPMSTAYLERLPQAGQAELARRHPLGFGDPPDLAGPVAFLLSDDSRWMTGTVLTVDGGYSAG